MMKKFIKSVQEYSLEEKISLVLLLSGLLMSSFGFITNLAFNMPFTQNWPNLVNAIYLVSILYFFGDNIFQISKITILIIGFVYFPYLFVMSNGHLGAGPIYFLMIIVYIAFFHRGKSLLFTLFGLLTLYLSLIILSYLHPELVVPYTDDLTRLIDIIIAFTSVSIVVSVIGYVVFTEYSREKEIIQNLMSEVQLKNVILEETSITDSLTKTRSRKFFMETLNQKFDMEKKVFVLMLDIDHFKQVNDTYGHLFGDEVLKEIAETLIKSTRNEDIVARYGGEEFSILIDCEQCESVSDIAERIRINVQELSFDNNISVTISIGVTKSQQDDTSYEILKRADDNLYLAKQQGRNKVIYK